MIEDSVSVQGQIHRRIVRTVNIFNSTVTKNLFKRTVRDDVNATVLKTPSQNSAVEIFSCGAVSSDLHRILAERNTTEARYLFWLSNMCGRGFIFQQVIDPEHACKLLYIGLFDVQGRASTAGLCSFPSTFTRTKLH